MQSDGFQVVTDIYGQYRMDYEANKKCKIIFNFSCRRPSTNKEAKEKRIEGTETETAIGTIERGDKNEMINNIYYHRYTLNRFSHLTLVLFLTSFSFPSFYFSRLKMPQRMKMMKTRVKCL